MPLSHASTECSKANISNLDATAEVKTFSFMTFIQSNFWPNVFYYGSEKRQIDMPQKQLECLPHLVSRVAQSEKKYSTKINSHHFLLEGEGLKWNVVWFFMFSG